MNNLIPPRMQEYVLWPLVAVCVVLGAVSGGTERALYFLAAIFLFAFSRQQTGELLGIISDIQKRLAGLSRELAETAGTLDKRVVLIENETKRLGADLEILKIPPPKPAFARAFAAGIMMLIIGCCLVFLLLRSDLKTVAYRLDRYENSLSSAQERIGTAFQRGDEMLNRVSLTESRLQELSGDVRDGIVSALAQCIRPNPGAKQAASIYRNASQPRLEAISSSKENASVAEPGSRVLQLVNETSSTSTGKSSPPVMQETLPAVQPAEPRASASFRSFRQER